MSTLEAAYDDPDDPAELTIYAPDPAARETCWLTIDVKHAVSPQAMA